MVVEGNHELEEQAENQTFVAYSSLFAFPSEESQYVSTLYYAFNTGGIHFIILGQILLMMNQVLHEFLAFVILQLPYSQ